MNKKVAVIALVLAVLTPLLAFARHAPVRDPNDTRGRLDIKRAEMVTARTAKWKLTTWSPWTPKQLWDRGFILIYVDTFGSRRADYYALVRSNGRRMVGSLYRDRARKKDVWVRSLRTRHPRGKIVIVAIPLQKLRRRDSKLFSWHTLTMISGRHCRRFCFDRAPDDGSVTEPGPAPSPTLPPPTPTLPPPSPTPTTTP
ncbi:MAG: hypothetical protein KY391_01565 [Actinobacteria bacterium]|nr:hypothetical protein [Actinomycetota bacterium]